MLLSHHKQVLVERGITPETWQRARLHSGSEAEVRDVLGYGGAGTGLIIPYGDDFARVRIDSPGPDGGRYRSPSKKKLAGAPTNRVYVPAILDPTVLDNVAIPLHATEGELKSLKATQEGFPTVALPGVWSWKMQWHGKSLPIQDLDRIAWKGRHTAVVFDSDAADKPPVAWAEHGLCRELARRGANVAIVRLPSGPKGEKMGLDDLLVAHGPDAFRQLPMVTMAEADQESPTFLRISDLADLYLLRVGQAHHRIALGYDGLNGIIRGIAPGEVMTILGRSGVGKTAFALNLAERMTVQDRLPTLIFSLEQPGAELFERIASMTIGWHGREIEERARTEDPELSGRLVEVCEHWEHVVVVEKPCTLDRLDGLLTESRGLWPDPLRLVVVDYLGLIGQRRPTSPYEHTSAVARELKNLAKRHRVAIVVLCQVDREGGSGGEEITLRMARDSGVIEEAADYLLGIWRPELREGLPKEERLKLKGQLKARVLKNRHGPAPRTVTLHFEDTLLRISPAAVAVDS
jgi:hypothetical protein